jgi:two-component system CheB/CheR fusion protein
VLIIEDNVDAADTLKDLLELGGHRVETAYDGAQGIAKARQLKPDVVLCDIGLPGLDGYEVARALRADQTLCATCLVALTGYAQLEDQRRAAEAGFDKHLSKPPTPEQIEEVLSQAAGRSSSDES